ncbi:hypothetical protein ACK32R_03755 [Aeromonas dhakensis]|uniref:hypothetical protein n=1 Tax=Aeromonas dhakensis TaxID=196024 RepID=UPI0039864AA5
MNSKIVSGLTAVDALKGAAAVWLNVGNTPQCLKEDGWLKVSCQSANGISIKDLIDAMHLYSECYPLPIDEIKTSNVYISKDDPLQTHCPELAKLTYQSVIEEINERSISRDLMKLALSLNDNPCELVKSKNNRRAL